MIRRGDGLSRRSHAWRGALLTAFLVALPTNAWAECAWVLWNHIVFPALDGENSSTRVSASQTLEECRVTTNVLAQKELAEYNRKWPGSAQLREAASVSVSPPKGSKAMILSFDCWPDTVDPRVPKGSGR